MAWLPEKTAKVKAEFLLIYPTKACNIAETCKQVRISRQCYYNWRYGDEEFRKGLEDAEESLIDFAETQLVKNIKDGKETSLIFFLKTKGKKRGYIESQEIVGDNQVNIKVVYDEDKID